MTIAGTQSEGEFRGIARDDALLYTIVRRKTLSHDDVRVTVNIEMLVTTALQEPERVRIDVMGALRQFIKGANWQLGPVQRDTGSVVGYEQVRVTARADVPARENFNLPGRAQQASRQGLILKYPDVDYRLPNHMVDAALRELRLQTLATIREDLADYRMATGRPWRIGRIEFGIVSSGQEHTVKGAQRDVGYLQDEDGMDGGSGNSECITLVTQVALHSDQLRISPDVPAEGTSIFCKAG